MKTGTVMAQGMKMKAGSKSIRRGATVPKGAAGRTRKVSTAMAQTAMAKGKYMRTHKGPASGLC